MKRHLLLQQFFLATLLLQTATALSAMHPATEQKFTHNLSQANQDNVKKLLTKYLPKELAKIVVSYYHTAPSHSHFPWSTTPQYEDRDNFKMDLSTTPYKHNHTRISLLQKKLNKNISSQSCKIIVAQIVESSAIIIAQKENGSNSILFIPNIKAETFKCHWYDTEAQKISELKKPKFGNHLSNYDRGCRLPLIGLYRNNKANTLDLVFVFFHASIVAPRALAFATLSLDNTSYQPKIKEQNKDAVNILLFDDQNKQDYAPICFSQNRDKVYLFRASPFDTKDYISSILEIDVDTHTLREYSTDLPANSWPRHGIESNGTELVLLDQRGDIWCVPLFYQGESRLLSMINMRNNTTDFMQLQPNKIIMGWKDNKSTVEIIARTDNAKTTEQQTLIHTIEDLAKKKSGEKCLNEDLFIIFGDNAEVLRKCARSMKIDVRYFPPAQVFKKSEVSIKPILQISAPTVASNVKKDNDPLRNASPISVQQEPLGQTPSLGAAQSTSTLVPQITPIPTHQVTQPNQVETKIAHSHTSTATVTPSPVPPLSLQVSTIQTKVPVIPSQSSNIPSVGEINDGQADNTSLVRAHQQPLNPAPLQNAAQHDSGGNNSTLRYRGGDEIPNNSFPQQQSSRPDQPEAFTHPSNQNKHLNNPQSPKSSSEKRQNPPTNHYPKIGKIMFAGLSTMLVVYITYKLYKSVANRVVAGSISPTFN